MHSLLWFLLHFSSTMAFLYSQNNKFVIYIGRRASTGDNDYSVPDLLSMRVSELKDELKFLNVNYADCFDKESLMSRLQQARDNEVANVRVANTEQDSANDSRYSDINQDPEANDEKSILENIRSMSVKELRGELGYLNIRWSDMLEKEDLVRFDVMSTWVSDIDSHSVSTFKIPSIYRYVLYIKQDKRLPNFPCPGRLLLAKSPT